MRKLSSPQEIETWYVIPAIRRELVLALEKLGMQKKDIAEALGLTQAAVSQYLFGKRGNRVEFDNEFKKEILKSAVRIKSGSNAMRELQKICNLARKKMIVCKLSQTFGYAPKGCRVCFE